MSDRDKDKQTAHAGDPFGEYRRAADPSRREAAYYWRTAIGLQEVDGLAPSPYLIETAKRQVEGEITLEDARYRIEAYYEERQAEVDTRTEEADKVSARIASLLAERGFTFSVGEILSLHGRLFEGIYPHAGQLRTYNITKKEWVLGGDTVTYGTAPELRATLEYDLQQERGFAYAGLTEAQRIRRLAAFLAGLWQIHPFAEGNTRTFAVFFIKYLRFLGYEGVTNDAFAEHSIYFRNALVRANYTNLRLSVHATTEYLETFLRNLLLNEDHPLHNRALHVSAAASEGSVDQKQDIAAEKQDIGRQKQDIGAEMQDNVGGESDCISLGKKGKAQSELLRSRLTEDVFGREQVMAILGLSPAAASAFLKKLLLSGVIVTVSGQGKGKYSFRTEKQ
ncbi:MAG: Fic family protein [Clostridia bacterium]|nr:Fic family protein [Clostridia bacterium]